MKNLRHRTKGFTLVEIMIVVLIIGVLMAIAIPNFLNARKTSQTNACIANLKQIQAASEQYAIVNKTYPTSMDALTTGTTPFLKSTPTCPATGVAYVIGTDTKNPACGSVETYPDHKLP